jgi:hypothetical protein
MHFSDIPSDDHLHQKNPHIREGNLLGVKIARFVRKTGIHEESGLLLLKGAHGKTRRFCERVEKEHHLPPHSHTKNILHRRRDNARSK